MPLNNKPSIRQVRVTHGESLSPADHNRSLLDLHSAMRDAFDQLFNQVPLLNGVLVEGKTLLSGVNFIQHGLGRKAKGYLVMSQDGAGFVFLSAANNPRPESHIALETDTPQMTVSLWIF